MSVCTSALLWAPPARLGAPGATSPVPPDTHCPYSSQSTRTLRASSPAWARYSDQNRGCSLVQRRDGTCDFSCLFKPLCYTNSSVSGALARLNGGAHITTGPTPNPYPIWEASMDTDDRLEMHENMIQALA